MLCPCRWYGLRREPWMIGPFRFVRSSCAVNPTIAPATIVFTSRSARNKKDHCFAGLVDGRGPPRKTEGESSPKSFADGQRGMQAARNLQVSECDQGIDADRAARGNVASEQRDANEKQRDTGKRQGIGRTHAIEQTYHQTRHQQRTHQPEGS